MSGIHSFSHRQNERKLELRPVDKHKFSYSISTLSHMFNDFPIFVEMGGLLGLAYALRTDTQGGIRDDEKGSDYSKRRSLYMTNEYPLPPVRPFIVHVKEGFADDMLKILIFAGVISIVAGMAKHPSDGWIEGFAILVCVAIVVLVGAYNNYKQEVAYRDLASSLKGADISAIRNGKQVTIPQNEILVGDLVHLNPGNMIPADGVIADQTSVRVNESSITGESDEKVKSISIDYSDPKNAGKTADPFLSAGTEIVDGSCVMLVTAVGDNSTKGKIMKSLATLQEFTNLQIRLAKVAELAAYIGLVCGLGAFIALLSYFFVDGKHNYISDSWPDLVDIFVVSVTVVIVAVPEGLPLAVTISMAYSMNKMRDDSNLVKVLAACETMGNATAICSDKTGTLTQNKMTVVQSYIGGRYFARQPRVEEIHLTLHKLIIDSVILNSNRRMADEQPDLSVAPEDWKWDGDGGATESALLSWLARYHNVTAASSASKVPGNENATPTADHRTGALTFGRDIMQLRKDNRDRIIQVYPFSSAKKYSSVITAENVPSIKTSTKQVKGSSITINDPNATATTPASPTTIDATNSILPPFGRQYYKGAADRVIKRCSKIITADGSILDAGSLDDLPNLPTNGTMDGMCQHCTSSSDGVKDFCNKWALLAPKKSRNADGTPGKPTVCGVDSHFPTGTSVSDYELVEQHPLKVMMNMTRVGLRCIAFAYVDNVPLALKDGQFVEPEENPDAVWHLIGLVGIQDPLRIETTGAVMTVQNAGIIVRMVTGDNLDTATFIAKDCGIISHRRHIALEGVDFRHALESNERHRNNTRDKSNPKDVGQDDPKFVDLVRNLRVMARCQPDDKLELVKYLKEQGEVVGVTGDGSNDGPALKAANVGLAMGIAGTEVSKAAADIIILDDNFSSIVKSVMWGRSVFDNIRKFLQFQLSVNFCALVVAFVGALNGGKEPLKPIQLLWVNLVMDSMGALAIGTEIPKPELLRRKAYRPDAPLISNYMWRNIIGQAIFQVAILMPLLFTGQDWFPRDLHHWVSIPVDINNPAAGTTLEWTYFEDKHYTFIFNTFVWLQLFNEINSRKCNGEINVFSGIFDNNWFVSISLITYLFQALVIEVFGSFMMTEPQSWQLWLAALGLGASQLVTGFILNISSNSLLDPIQGQIVRDEQTFENARWISNPQLIDDMYKFYRSKDQVKNEGGLVEEDVIDKVRAVYIGAAFGFDEINRPDTLRIEGTVKTSSNISAVALSSLKSSLEMQAIQEGDDTDTDTDDDNETTTATKNSSTLDETDKLDKNHNSTTQNSDDTTQNILDHRSLSGEDGVNEKLI